MRHAVYINYHLFLSQENILQKQEKNMFFSWFLENVWEMSNSFRNYWSDFGYVRAEQWSNFQVTKAFWCLVK